MTPNRTLIEKADLAIADLQSDGGYLSDQQSDKFIRLAIKESVLLQQIAVTPMRGPREEMNKIRFSNRVLRPASDGQALAASQRVKPDLSQFTLDAKEFKADVRLSDSTMEDSIERGSFADTVSALLAAAVGRDIEYIAVQGDVLSGDATLAVLDGFLKQATANLTAAGGVNLTKDILKDMLKSLPDEFAKTERLRYYTNRQARVDYRDSIANRATPAGDAALQQSDRTVYQDMPVVAVPEFPGGGTTQVLLSDPANLTVGFHRKIRIEKDRDIAAGVNLLVATVRFDVKIQEVNAVAKATNVSTT
jgi:HK97 family phage major capsid protein